MTQVFQLRQSEAITIDRARIDEIMREHGRLQGEAMIARQIEEICALTFAIEDEVEAAVQNGAAFDLARLSRIAPTARRAAGLCTEIGLVSLGRVARDLGIAALCNDPVALRAIWERFVRIGDHSLVELWQNPGLSM